MRNVNFLAGSKTEKNTSNFVKKCGFLKGFFAVFLYSSLILSLIFPYI